MMANKTLQFAPFNSFLDAGFWHNLSDKKLNIYGLDETPKPIHGFYFNGDPVGVPCRMNVEYTAFDEDFKTPARCFKTLGTLHTTNTIETFKECDKKSMLVQSGKQVWEDIISGKALEDPTLLSRFLLLTHADLKKYIYYYWFAFPCLCPPCDVSMVTAPVTLDKAFSSEQIKNLESSYDNFQSSLSTFVGYFLVTMDTDIQVLKIKNMEKYIADPKKVLLAFADPCTLGWEDLIALAEALTHFVHVIAYTVNDFKQSSTGKLYSFHCMLQIFRGDKLEEVQVLCFRDHCKDGVRDVTRSLVFTVKLTSIKQLTECPKCVGWEKNERQKLGPRTVNLSSSMDPSKLSESAVDLNLKLMRWRLLPELDLDQISRTKCLLLGAGTLGCNVARCLMGWGVRKITLVDNGKVSYSNPVRQSLFLFEDCMQGGRPKAEAAALSLQKIFPGIDAQGIAMSIPMPGHPVSGGSLQGTKKDVQQLEDLIKSHDAVFLLLDTRESRWLPTVMAAAHKKIVICAALGFDTFLVMRHGVKSDTETDTSVLEPLSSYTTIPGDQLGCYFCNDVVAPGNSTRDRTLDQQCTVSRPGMSFLASALAVELLVSLIQHPKCGKAEADTSAKDDHLTKDLPCSLGLVPHQIRCFLSRYHQVLPACRAFDKCTACSNTVVNAFKKEGVEFLLRVFNEPSSYLEDLTGLTQMHLETLDTEILDFSDEDDSFMDMS
ncbi:ubiquitin-like modifier-activating enzyme ATG7 [Ylistrum balloti]|uniref:ubiquitin-like modifier-activating enzyme ATG7 n=1 Tax=Ylistrum balloti TaxID=509963 RepID=UPI002905B9E3|nr:ubiquitin-like modifier-activating enzyme ATG7 [Ylistrum balloti]